MTDTPQRVSRWRWPSLPRAGLGVTSLSTELAPRVTLGITAKEARLTPASLKPDNLGNHRRLDLLLLILIRGIISLETRVRRLDLLLLV